MYGKYCLFCTFLIHKHTLQRSSSSSRNVINGVSDGAGGGSGLFRSKSADLVTRGTGETNDRNESNFDIDAFDFVDSDGIYRELEELVARYYRQKQNKLEKEKTETTTNNKMDNKQQHSRDDLDATNSKLKMKANNKNNIIKF